MEMKRTLLGAVALFAMFGAVEANAQGSVTQNINVAATVPETCVISGSGTALDINFGTIDTSNALDGTATAIMTWRCSQGTPIQIELNDGDTAGSTASNRLMIHTNGTDTLAYLLCQDLACTTPWGDGTVEADKVKNGVGMGTATNETVYGFVAAADAQAAVPGDYSETVVISVNW